MVTVLETESQLPPPKKSAQPPPIFGPCILWPNGWMIKMLLGTGVGLGPGHIVLDEDPAYLLLVTFLLLVDDGLCKRQLFSCPYLPGNHPICS